MTEALHQLVTANDRKAAIATLQAALAYRAETRIKRGAK